VSNEDNQPGSAATALDRAITSVSAVADETVSTVSTIGTALAEGVVVTMRDIRTGIRQRRIRPGTVVVAAVIGLVGAAELPLVLAAGGAAVIISKFRRQTAGPDHESNAGSDHESNTVEAPDAVAPAD